MASNLKLIVEDTQIQILREELNLNNPKLSMSEAKLKRGTLIEIDFKDDKEQNLFLENIRKKGVKPNNKLPL